MARRKSGEHAAASSPAAIRSGYAAHGVDAFYRQFGDTYRNPHEPAIRKALERAAGGWGLDLSHVLDLACGSGEVTLALQGLGAGRIDGIDPYTAEAYRTRTGQEADELAFEDIAEGALAGRRYSLVMCSFALHLLEESRLPLLAYRLAEITDTLLVLTPHKRPHLKEEWGWVCRDEFLVDRVRARLYRRPPVALSPGRGG